MKKKNKKANVKAKKLTVRDLKSLKGGLIAVCEQEGNEAGACESTNVGKWAGGKGEGSKTN